MTDPERFLAALTPTAGRALPLAMAARVAHGALAVVAAWLFAGILDGAIFKGRDLAALLPMIATLAAVHLGRAGVAVAAEYAAIAASAAVRRQLFRRLVDHVVALGPIRLADIPTGDLVTTLVEAVAGTDPFWRRWLPTRAAVATLPLVILAVAGWLDWRTGLIFLATLPLLPVFMVLAGRSAERASARQWTLLTRLGGHLLDAIQGLADLHLLGAARRQIAVVAAMADGYRRATMAVLRIAFLSALVLEFFATISIAVTAVLVGFRLMWGEIDFRTGFFLLLLAPELYAPLRRLGADRHAKMEAVAAAEKIVAVLNRAAPATTGGAPFAPGRAVEIRFEAVSARYDDGRDALTDVSFAIAAGEHVALVGPSGAGKSTVLALLLGFLEPSAGRILIDGMPLDTLNLADWRRAIAHVPQRPHLFDGSIADNVALGRPEASEAEIRAALAAARADAFVDRLPDGLASRLGDRVLGISGGEAQRLMLARAFLAPAPLVVFDEPTAHLDAATEADILARLAAFARGRTALVVAHRPATIRAADRILVLDDGRVVEDGRHDDLAAAGGVYARMINAAPMAETAA